MRKAVFIAAFFLAALSVFAQRISTVAIAPFEADGQGVSAAEAAEATSLVTAQMRTPGTFTLLEGNETDNADYLVRGWISRENNQLVLSASLHDARTGRIIHSHQEQALSLGAISILTFCARLADYIPYPVYYWGTWRAVVDTIDGPMTCVLEFRSDRTVQVLRYDTWEHRGTDSLRYQAIGTGTYSFSGHHFGWALTLGGRQFRANATFGLNIALEDALPKYESVSVRGFALLFNESKNGFELLNGGLPFGDNFTGPSVYPNEHLFYTEFTKIQ